MAKTVLGIDVGYDSLKLALVKGRQVKKTAVVPMPNSLIRAGRVVSVETMGDLRQGGAGAPERDGVYSQRHHADHDGRSAQIQPAL